MIRAGLSKRRPKNFDGRRWLWYAEWREAGRRSKKHKDLLLLNGERLLTEKQAQRAYRDWSVRYGTSGSPNPRKGRTVLRSFVNEKWLKRRKVRTSTSNLTTWALERYILPRLGSLPLGLIDRETVSDFKADLEELGKMATAEKVFNVLKTILAAAEEWDYIPKNPARKIGIDYEPKEREEISINNMCRIISAADQWWKPYIVAGFLTGLRRSEQYAVTRADILWESDTIQVNKQRPAWANGKATDPKTKRSRRYVDMMEPVKTVLLDVMAQDMNSGPDTLIFTTPNGKPIEHRNFERDVWNPLMEKLGLHYKPHDMRYTFGSLLLYFTGGNLTYVAEQMGHSSIDMLAGTYARTVKETKKGRRLEQREVFAQVLAAYRSVPAPEEAAQPVRS